MRRRRIGALLVASWLLAGCHEYERWSPQPTRSDESTLGRILGTEAAKKWLDATELAQKEERRNELPRGMTPQEFYRRMRPRAVSPVADDKTVLEAARDNDCRIRTLYGHEISRMLIREEVGRGLLEKLTEDSKAGEENASQRKMRELLGKSLPLPGDSRIGLCLSGGGIRSTAFATGVLRGLHDLGVMRRLGYLSTVSGGGFAGAWYETHLDDADLFRPGSPHLERLMKEGSYLWNGHFSRSNWELAKSVSLHVLYLPLIWVYNFAVDLQKNDLSYFRVKYRDAIAQAFLYDNPSWNRQDGIFSLSLINWVTLAGVLAMFLWPDAIAAEVTRFLERVSSDPVDPLLPNQVQTFGAITFLLLPILGPSIAAPGTALGQGNIKDISFLKPYWIANAHISLTDSSSPFVKSRSGDAFEFTQERCGADAVGYVASGYDRRKFADNSWQELASICAISGAAVDSESLQQGELASAGMKVAGLDLGYWVPAWGKGWVEGDCCAWWNTICYLWNVPLPTRWLTYVFSPSTHGLHEDAGSYLLTDGGHFDNLGLYALVRRGCRTIIVCDATSEPLTGWATKSTAERAALFASFQESAVKILADFGASITLDFASFDPMHKPRATADRTWEGPQLVMKGRIEGLPFFNVTGHPESGVSRNAELIYIRAAYDHGRTQALRDSFIAGEKAANPEFPNLETGDQDYTESQMAAMMQLGYRAVLNQREAFAAAIR